ncbi:MAG: LacI family DNA-binding transcriptional regulator [Cetobacterium sp.]
MKKDINIIEVAKLAGVSTATVSRVFNKNGSVKESTKNKIEKIIRETGYQPNILARELANKKTNIIGIIAHSISGDAVPNSINAINSYFGERGYVTMLATTNANHDREREYIDLFRKKKVEGIILFTNRLVEEVELSIKNSQIPFTVLFQESKVCDSVVLSDEEFGFEITQKVLEKNHINLSFIGGPENSVNSTKRKNGFLNALAKKSIEPKGIYYGDFTIESSYNLCKKIIGEKNLPTAFVVANDGMAIGIINCLIDSGIKVPEDISVVGMDNTQLAMAARPKLTTVSYSYEELGKVGAELVYNKIMNLNKKNKKIKIDFKITYGESLIKL